jgi:hypothetical protein
MKSVYADGYAAFGWELENTFKPLAGVAKVTMQFRRDRKIRNKAELTRLGHQFDSLVSEIAVLERSKFFIASVIAYIIGTIGTALMAGSVFAVTASVPYIPLCVILGIPALAGWLIPYFLFANIRARKTEQVTPLIDGKHEEIYEICERANSLLA